MILKSKPDIRERVLERGFRYPSNMELIMLLLGTGTKKYPVEELASKVLDILDSTDVNDLPCELQKISGIGEGKALSIAAALEFGRRRTSHLQAVIKHPTDIIPFVQMYAMKTQEHFLSIVLSGAFEILKINVVSVGTINKTIIHPREIFTDAIHEHGSAIIVCHNHPSGNCTPSDEDIKTTKSISKAAEILGIALLDHIIICKNSFYSFQEHKML